MRSVCLALLCGTTIDVAALDLDIAAIPLEIAPTAPPNVLLLLDNSAGMDFEVLTQNAVNAGLFNAPNPDGTGGFANITQRVPGTDGGADSNCESFASTFGGYGYAVAFESNEHAPNPSPSRNCYVAADEAWRFRNHDFNPFYFDPDETYEPWSGEYDLDGDGVTEPFSPADIQNAVDDPINPQHSIDLTLHKSGLNTSRNRIAGIGFKYYAWADTNNDGNFDNGEQTEFLIRDQDATTQQNFANWFVYHRSRELVAKAILSELVTDTTAARVGLGVFNSSGSNGLPIALLNQLPSAGNKSDLLKTIFETQLVSGSPIRASLEKAGLYFACEANDIFGSSSSSNPGDTACPLLAAPAGTCQSNQVIMFTGSFQDSSFSSSSGIADDDSDNNTDFDGGAFADGNSGTLADIAMNFYERDLHGAGVLTNEVPATLNDILSFNGTSELRLDDTLHQHMKTNIVALGLQGTGLSKPADPTTAFTWTDHNNPGPNGAEFVDGMLHAAYNGRGRFLQAFGSSDLKQQLESVFKSTTTASIPNATLAFNTQSITEDTVVYRSFSSIAANSGDVVAQGVNADGSLVVGASNNPVFVWQAAPLLESAAPGSRLMITYSAETVTRGGREFALGPSGLTANQVNDLAIPAATNVSPPSAIVDTRVDYLRGSRADEGNDFASGDMRVRIDLGNEVGLGGKIGDIVHSGPVFVGAPQFTQRFAGAWPSGDDSYAIFRDDPANENRQQLVYVGSNAGMLHAFQANNGAEKFAYVPNALLDELCEFTSPDYTHRFYVDATPRVNDAFIDPNGVGASRSWNTILIGGLGAGGKAYYALNITDPSQFNSAANAVDQVLWEFSEADDDIGGGASDLGFTYSEPVIGMSNVTDSGDQEWVAIFGNGYNSTSTTGNAVIYIAFIEKGIDGWSTNEFIKIDTGEGFSSADNANNIRNGIADIRAIDEDGNGTLDRFYAGDLLGNVYVANISSNDPGDWNDTDNLKIIFKARYGSGFPRNAVQPITTRPEVIKHPNGNGFIVIVATGSYFTNDDATSTAIQSIYGLWDDSPAFSAVGIGGNFPIEFKNPTTSDQLIEQTITAALNGSELVRTSTNNIVSWENTAADQVRGWYLDFDVPPENASPPDVEFPGERAVHGLVLQEGILFFNTIIPQDGLFCLAPEGGFISALNPETGGSGLQPVFDINNDFVIDATDYLNNIESTGNLIVGVRSDSGLGDTIVVDNYVGGGTLDGGSKFIRIVDQDTINADIAPLLGRHSWKQIEY